MLKNNKKQGRIVGTLVITTCLMLGVVWLLGHLLLATNPNSSTLIASETGTGGAAGSSLGSMADLAKGAVADTAKQIGLGGGSDAAPDANESNGDASDALAANDDSSEFGNGVEPIHDQTADVRVTTDDIDFETDRSDSAPSGTIDFAASEPQNGQHGFDAGGDGGIEFENDDVASTTVDPIGSTDSGFGDRDTTPDWSTDSNDSASNPLANVGTDFGNDSTDIGSPNLETPDPLETSSLTNNATEQSETNGSNFNTDVAEPAVTDPNIASASVKPELDKQSPKVNVLRPRYKPESVERKMPSANTPVATKKYPVRSWTSTDQKQVQASYVSQDKTSVILAVRGKLYRVPLTRFERGDLDYLKHVATEGQKAP